MEDHELGREAGGGLRHVALHLQLQGRHPGLEPPHGAQPLAQAAATIHHEPAFGRVEQGQEAVVHGRHRQALRGRHGREARAGAQACGVPGALQGGAQGHEGLDVAA